MPDPVVGPLDAPTPLLSLSLGSADALPIGPLKGWRSLILGRTRCLIWPGPDLT
jgi:hypothetical protein